MWSLEQDGNDSRSSSSRGYTRVASSSSSNSFSIDFTSQTPNRRAMEEQWKDFSTPPHLDPQTYQRLPLSSSSPSFRGTTLQDFLDEQFRRTEEPPLPPPPYPPAPPQTALSLNSGLAFQFLVPHNPNAHSSASSGAAHATSFISSAFSAAICGPPSPAALWPKKRTPEMHPLAAAAAADRYHKRMIKNRESAARSRARKQAYTNELELEVSHLKEENARLRKENEELHMAIGNHSRRRSSRLQRCSSAPF